MNIVFDRVGRVDPVTRGIQIAVNWIGLEIDVKFWSQHVSFILVGIIVISSIRGLLITLTKVGGITRKTSCPLLPNTGMVLISSIKLIG